MMKVFICPNCGWMRIVSRRSVVECHKCGLEQMTLSNLSMVDYTNMSEQERKDYVTGWMYIHSRKGRQNGKQKEKEIDQETAAETQADYFWGRSVMSYTAIGGIVRMVFMAKD